MKRRSFLQGAAAGGAISVLDWLGWFERYGVPGTQKSLGLASAAAQAAGTPHFLIYWFQEGGWDSYCMLSPVDTPNHATMTVPAGTLNPMPSWSQQFYRPKGYPSATPALKAVEGNIEYGYLAKDGLTLFPDLAVVASHEATRFTRARGSSTTTASTLRITRRRRRAERPSARCCRRSARRMERTLRCRT